MQSKFAVLGFLAVLASSSTAFAANLDFASAAFAPGDGQGSFSYTASDGVTLTLTAGPNWQGARLQQDSIDGFGVSTILDSDPDEVDGAETLSLTFSQGVTVSDVFITDLFNEGYLEQGTYSVNGGQAISFSALQGQTTGGSNGSLTLDLDTVVTSLTFSAPSAGFFRQNDFAVRGINYTVASAPATQVPELSGNAAPLALMLLIGCALLVNDRRARLS
jgi:hypothetical protein